MLLIIVGPQCSFSLTRRLSLVYLVATRHPPWVPLPYPPDYVKERHYIPDYVLSEELPDNNANVWAVDLVNETVDGLLERFPGQSLKGHRGLVRDRLLHQPQLGRRNVGTSGPSGQELFHLLLLLGLFRLLGWKRSIRNT